MDMGLDRREPGRGDGSPPQPHRPSREGMDLNGFFRLLWRRKGLIVATISICVAAAASFAFLATPRYEAVAQLLFEPAANLVADNIATQNREPQDEAAILSQVGVLQSRELALRVIDKLQLLNVEELNPKVGREIKLAGLLATHLPWLFGGDDRQEQAQAADAKLLWAPPPPLPRTAEETKVVDAFLSRLKVSPIGRSHVVEVTFTSEDPALAARIANVLADTYLVMRFEHKLQYARQASDWLASHAQQIRSDVEGTERTLETYRRTHNLLQGDRMTLLTQQLTDLNKELMTASHDRAVAEAELVQARQVARTGDIETLSQVLDSLLIQKLREEEIGLERSEAEFNERYGPLHPQFLELRAAKQRFQEKTKNEVSKIIRGLEDRVQVARLRERDLDRNLGALKEQAAEANTASVHLRTLERDVEASRLLLEKFMTSFIEISAQQDAQAQVPQASVISKAAVPQEPSFPSKMLAIFLGLVGGTVLSVPLAFAADAFGSGYRSAQDIEDDTGVPVLAHVPKVQIKRSDGALASYVVSKPDSVFTESIRLLCGRLLSTLSFGAHRSVLFVSSEAGEGKTTVTLAVARSLAKTGRAVIVIDADFRCGKVAEMLKLRHEMGLAELIAGAAGLEDVVQQDPQSTVKIISSGAFASESADDLGREAFSSLLLDLRSHYDLVLIDAPPFLALSSASLLAGKADATVVVAAWSATDRDVIAYTVEQIQRSAPRVAGIVLNKVDLRKNNRYDYGDARMFNSAGRKYYVS